MPMRRRSTCSRRSGATPPANEPDWRRFVERYAGRLDAVFIMTPHALHFEQATACLEAGLDVLLEKPMVMNAAEATALIATRDRTGRLLVVVVPGQPVAAGPDGVAACSDPVSSAPSSASTRSSGRTGRSDTAGTWRQDPALSGGGFLFDTGAHMLNTVADLAGEDFTRSRPGSRTTARRSTSGR